MSEKSTLTTGKGTIPGSEKTARVCEYNNTKITVLNKAAWMGPHKLKTHKQFAIRMYEEIIEKKNFRKKVDLCQSIYNSIIKSF